MSKVNISEYVRYSDDYVKARESARQHIANHEYNVFGQWVFLSDNLLRYCLVPVSMNGTMLWTSFEIEYTRDRTIITVSYTNNRTFDRHEVIVTLGNSFTCSSEDYSGQWLFENFINYIEV